MKRWGTSGLTHSLAAILLATLARAQEAPTSDVVMLPCDGKCATITRNVQNIGGADLQIPRQSPKEGHYAEGFVELQYTILADGTVSDDIAVLQLVGPAAFAEATKRTVRSYRYAPAIVDGRPVAIAHVIRAYFGVPGEYGARPSIIKGYEAVSNLMKNGMLDEASGQLKEMLNLPSLNYYERGMITYPLVLIALQRQQYAEASRLSGTAVTFGPSNFSDSTYRNLNRYHILALLELGDIVGAEKSLGSYKRWMKFDSSDPLIKQVSDAQKKLDSLPSYAVDAKIPGRDEADGFNMFLYRRYFTFINIKGKLNRVTTNCREQQVESPIAEAVEWSVPKNWSDCAILVRGDPGTTFQIVQFSSPSPDRH